MSTVIIVAIFLFSLAVTRQKLGLLKNTGVMSAVAILITMFVPATVASFALLAILAVFIFITIRYADTHQLAAARERVSTIVVLMVVATMFTLVVYRSDEGLKRYQLDIEQVIPSSSPLKLQSPDRLCTDIDPSCNPKEPGGLRLFKPDPEKLAQSALTIFKNSEQIASQYLAHINSLTNKLSGGITGRQNYLQWKLDLVKEHFDFAGYQKLIGKARGAYDSAYAQGQWREAYFALHELSDANLKFHNTMMKSREYSGNARNSMLLMTRGMWGLAILVLIVLMPTLRELAPHAPWHCFPMYVLLTGTGFCLVTDLSLNYLAQNRFLALGMANNLVMSFLFLVVICWLAGRPFFRRLINSWITHQTRSFLFSILFLVFILLVVAYLYATGGFSRITTKAYITSELFKGLFLVTIAWFATIRGEYIARVISFTGIRSYRKTREWIKENLSWEWIKENLIGFLLLIVISGAGFLLFKDFGPLLVVLTVFSFLIYLLMGGGSLVIIASLGGALATFLYLLRVPFSRVSGFSHIYARFYEFISPYAFGSGEISKLIWLRKAGGLFGFGMGKIPFFGYNANPQRPIIVTPAQMQSDYTVTQLYAQFGYIAATVGLIVYFIWLHTLLRNAAAGLKNSIACQDRFLAWVMVLGLVMMEVQALITITGNFGLFPLSGITLPFVSFGGWSLMLCTLILALCYTVKVNGNAQSI